MTAMPMKLGISRPSLGGTRRETVPIRSAVAISRRGVSTIPALKAAGPALHIGRGATLEYIGRHSTTRGRGNGLVSPPKAAGADGGSEAPQAALVGEDSAAFELEQQTVKAWALFFFLLTTVLVGLYLVWIQPGVGLADDYVQAIKSLTQENTEATMLVILGTFAVAHSGLAGLRSKGEAVIGERAYRVVFALVSLALAIVALVYFINHRYSGTPLWDVRGEPFLHEALWIVNFISFLFLYPSTFNILEVAAVDKPKVHLWETGIIRITRHPQMVGQAMWCLAHTIWIGNSFMVTTSLGLMAHHLFGCWHGDRRLSAKYGEAFEKVKARTSVLPFAAILDGRQQLPKDYHKEFLRVPYVAVVAFTVGAYLCHPLFQQASYFLGW
mmetsp:Transcript_36482/g.103046  ORF Transcript_36482/g.103046 Transcript_36482/m.103046 type:complete len:384 (-) Transcript_36482:303-1454(-)